MTPSVRHKAIEVQYYYYYFVISFEYVLKFPNFLAVEHFAIVRLIFFDWILNFYKFQFANSNSK